MNATRQGWVDTVQQLVLGSDRVGVDARELLDRLAALGVARRGALLAPASPEAVPVSSAPVEDSAVVSGPLAGLLDQILATEDPGLLHEWCSVVRSAGLVAAPRQLPDLLTIGNARPLFRSLLGAVVGARGVWLAGVRPIWSWASVQAELELVPDRSRLAEQFAGERRSTDRKALLTALAPSLEPSDEGFLEDALDDRAADVRAEAFRLLRQLSGTALERRAIIRLRDGLAVSDDGLDIRPDGPYARRETPEDEARDLGGQRTAIGSVASRLRGAAATLAPDAWPSLLRVDAPAVLRLVGESRWKVPLASGMLLGLPKSARPAAWADGLVAVLLGSDVLAVLRELPAASGAVVLSALAASPTHTAIESAAEVVAGPWPAETTLAMLRRFGQDDDPRGRAGHPPAVLIRRGDVGVLTTYWTAITERWPDHGREEYVLNLRRGLYEAASAEWSP